MNEAVFAVGPVAESVRISEIMYHPAESRPQRSETEYIELTNIGSEAVNLNLVRFTDGIEFTFPSFSLPPAAYCLVVKDLAAFEATYGPGLPVAGQYAGSLDNAGEHVELRDAAGRTIHSFRYRDDWYDQTDGEGFSLTLTDPHGRRSELPGRQGRLASQHVSRRLPRLRRLIRPQRRVAIASRDRCGGSCHARQRIQMPIRRLPFADSLLALSAGTYG